MMLATEDLWDKYLEVCDTFYSILAKHVSGANERVSLEPPEGRNLPDKAFGIFRRVVGTFRFYWTNYYGYWCRGK